MNTALRPFPNDIMMQRRRDRNGLGSVHINVRRTRNIAKFQASLGPLREGSNLIFQPAQNSEQPVQVNMSTDDSEPDGLRNAENYGSDSPDCDNLFL